MSDFIRFGGGGFDQQQRVVKLHVGVAKLEALIRVARLAVGGAEEVACSGTLDDGL